MACPSEMSKPIQPSKASLDRALSCPTKLVTDDGRELLVKCWEPSYDPRKPWTVEVLVTGFIKVHDALVAQGEERDVSETSDEYYEKTLKDLRRPRPCLDSDTSV